MEKQKRFSSLPQEERQLISLKVIKAISSYLQLFISPVIARRIISAILIPYSLSQRLTGFSPDSQALYFLLRKKCLEGV